MTTEDTEFNLQLSRRKLLVAAGPGGGLMVATSFVGIGDAEAAAPSRRSADPGAQRGGVTAIKVTYYDVVGPEGRLAPFETFTLRRPRRD